MKRSLRRPQPAPVALPPEDELPPSYPPMVGKRKKFLCYAIACEVVRAARIKTQVRYFRWKGRPADMPANREKTYRGAGWVSWGEFLGTGRARRSDSAQFLDYRQAKFVVLQANIRSSAQFESWKERPSVIPSNPRLEYLNRGWKGWHDFLGIGPVGYLEASSLARQAGITTQRAYAAWNRPDGVPASPSRVYRGKGWKSWREFLGTKPVPYEEAARRTRLANIRTSVEYRAWERPIDLPACPDVAYRGCGWNGWGEFLGTGRPCRMKRRRKR